MLFSAKDVENSSHSKRNTKRRQLPELKNPDGGEPGEGPWDREPEGCCPGKPLQGTTGKGSDSLSSRLE